MTAPSREGGPFRPPRPSRGPWLALASLALSAGAMALIARRAGVDVLTALAHLPWQAHVLALAAFGLEVAARGARIVAVARGLGIRLTLGTSVRAQLAGDALGAVTPSRVGSDPAKMAVFHRAGVGLGQGGALVLAEMVAEAVVLVLAALAVAAWVPGGWWVALGVGGYAVAVSASGVAAYVITGWPAQEPPALWRAMALGQARWGALRMAAGEFREHATALGRIPPGRVVQALGAAVAHIAAKLAILPVLVLSLARGSAGEAVAVSDLVLRPFFTLYATALLPPPGGGGGVEVVFASALRGVLAPATLAAALVWWRFYTFHLGAMLGWLSLVVSARRPHEGLDTRPSHEPAPNVSGAWDAP